MSAADRYFAELQERFAGLAERQRDAIRAAGELGARALVERRPLHIHDTGHLVNHELIARTGGLAAFTALAFGATVERENEWIADTRGAAGSAEDSARALVDWLFLQGTVIAGDVLFLSSVSGTNVLVVELARQARRRGVSVIALTGAEFSAGLAAQHSSGTRLFENADVVLDEEVPRGDAFLTVDGLESAVVPWSGISAAALMWAVTAEIVEGCVRAGLPPTVYPSVHQPGGPEAYARTRADYRELGR